MDAPTEAGLNYIGQISGFARVAICPRKCRHGQSTQSKLQVQPHKQTFTHMEFHNTQQSRTRAAKHPAVVLNAKIKRTGNSKFNARLPKAASTKMEAKLSAMPDTGAMMCIMGKKTLD